MSDNIKPWSNSGLTETEELLQKTQQLERDNVALLAGVLEQCMLNDKGSEREYVLRGKVERLERENAALREDKERLDWLEECHGWPEYIDAEWHVVGEVFSSYRAAIDAAIAAARKEAKP